MSTAAPAAGAGLRRMMARFRAAFFVVALTAAPAAPAGLASDAARQVAPELQFNVRESALFELLRAVTPYTVTVGTGLTAVDLILRDPSDLRLGEGKARFKIVVRGATIPVEQVLEPELTVQYDAQRRQYMIVVSRLAVQVPLLGAVDLRDALPPLTVPALVQRLWELDSRPIGTRFHIRRIAIVEDRLEIAADVDFPPVGGR